MDNSSSEMGNPSPEMGNATDAPQRATALTFSLSVLPAEIGSHFPFTARRISNV